MIYSVPVLCEVHFHTSPFFFNLSPCIESLSTKKTGNNFVKYMALSFQTGYNLTLVRSPFIKLVVVFKEH